MPFKKGEPRSPTAGRRAGAKNKRTMQMEERLAALNFDPLEFAVRVATGQEKFEIVISLGKDLGSQIVEVPAPPEVRVRAGMGLMEYLYPKRKAVEITGDTNLLSAFAEAVGRSGAKE